MTGFYKNLKEEVSMLSEMPDIEEVKNFTINGEELNDEAKIIYEKSRILLHFTHLLKENMDFVKYNAFRSIIEKLSDSVNNMNLDYELLKKIIVHVELELGMNVFFSTVLLDLLEKGLENIICYETEENLTYERLCEHYGKNNSKRFGG